MGQKLGRWAPPPYWGGASGSPSNTKSPGPSTICIPSGILIHPTILPQHIWAKKTGGSAPPPFRGGRAGSPSNTMWPGPRPTCLPSFILIRPTVWPQEAYTNVTGRKGQDRQRSDSIGRTVLQTVAQKPLNRSRCVWDVESVGPRKHVCGCTL